MVVSRLRVACPAVLLGCAAGLAQEPSNDSVPSTAAAFEQRSEYEYVGTKRCRMCHTAWYKSWLRSSKSRAFEALKPGVGVMVKRKAGLDVSVDYTTDPRCLRCHTVGFGKPGGYSVPDLADGRALRRAAVREGVGCESCHGPGSGFVVVMQEIILTQRAYRREEVLAAGRRIVTREVCLSCHNSRAICMIPQEGQGDSHQVYEFKVDLSDTRGFHEHFPLKYLERKADSVPSAHRNGDAAGAAKERLE
ncbi:MAG: cytochrome c family protein [Phycisphaerae bacterium]